MRWMENQAPHSLRTVSHSLTMRIGERTGEPTNAKGETSNGWIIAYWRTLHGVGDTLKTGIEVLE